jgi:hypothetical protein
VAAVFNRQARSFETCSNELGYTEQTSSLLFLKYLDALEHEKATK